MRPLYNYGTDEPEQLLSECSLEVQRISQLGDADSNFAVLKDAGLPPSWGTKAPRGQTTGPDGSKIVRFFLLAATAKGTGDQQQREA